MNIKKFMCYSIIFFINTSCYEIVIFLDSASKMSESSKFLISQSLCAIGQLCLLSYIFINKFFNNVNDQNVEMAIDNQIGDIPISVTLPPYINDTIAPYENFIYDETMQYASLEAGEVRRIPIIFKTECINTNSPTTF